jgi:phenylacetate-coenzyme A ligase PaaK-like adenylate-forming protein
MQTSNSNQTDEAEWDRLTEEMERLEGRLEAGMALYEASVNPDQRERYYNKWIVVLREYEAKCQQRRKLIHVTTAAK